MLAEQGWVLGGRGSLEGIGEHRSLVQKSRDCQWRGGGSRYGFRGMDLGPSSTT